MTPEKLTKQLRELGLVPGDVVLVHSSLSGLGWINGGAHPVIDALLAAVDESGTVLFPTLTGGKTNGPDHPPTIDLATTPAQSWVGIIPETARQRPDAHRSIHPTHSVVALGANREIWTEGHELGASPCDEASPYHRLMDRGGKILLLGGVTHESNTSLHCIEEIARVPYHLQKQATDGVVVVTKWWSAIACIFGRIVTAIASSFAISVLLSSHLIVPVPNSNTLSANRSQR